MKQTGYFNSSDGRSRIYYVIWKPDGETVCTLQILHGMTEHVGRYEVLAEYLNRFGVAVAGHDHIGHGHSAAPEDHGYFGKKDGWKHLVEDADLLHEKMQEWYPDVPHFLYGHSMGSFIARTYLAKYHGKDLCGALIEGTAGTNSAVGVGIIITRLLGLLKGDRSHSPLVTALAFGSYNERIPDVRTERDWLTSDSECVSAYLADPLSGFQFTLGGYKDLLTLMKVISKEEWYASYPRELPTFFLAGREDPVGNYGAGPTAVVERLQACGCHSVELKLYDRMRHEPHNEIGKEVVFEDMKNFIFRCMDDGKHRK